MTTRRTVGVVMMRILILAIVCRLVLVSSTNLAISSRIQILKTYRGGEQQKQQPRVSRNQNQKQTQKNISQETFEMSDFEDNNEDEEESSLSSTQDEEEEEEEEGVLTYSNSSDDTAVLIVEANPRNIEKRKMFFNRMAKASFTLLNKELDAQLVEEKDEDEDQDTITPQSDLTIPGRHIHIVTTASLPWMTGTAVNPLLRAAYLHHRLQRINNNNNNTQTKERTSWVTLVIPWLELPEDREKLYHGHVFNSTEEQEKYVRHWLKNHAHMPDAAKNLNIVFYNARYHAGLGSVFAMGDIINQLPEDELDVCILEEPEHVNWFRAPGQGWTKRYNYVVGIVHTNYDQYATQHYSGLWTAPAIRVMSAAMIRAYCHKVIKLSDILQPFAPEKEVTENVHGVRQEFIQSSSIQSGRNETRRKKRDESNEETGEIYFIGKLLWTKGLNLMLELEEYYKQMTGNYFTIDIYGSGPDQDEIMKAFLGRRTEGKKKRSRRTNNLFVKVFTWAYRRRSRRKVSTEVVYKDILEALDEYQTIAKESVGAIPSKFRDSMQQLSDDLVKAKGSIENLPSKARKTMDKLARDLSRFSFKIETSSFPRTLYELRRQPIPASFPGRVDHAALKHSHKIFVNPSISEVLCTTTAEALAMGKFVIIPVHPSNTFFLKFPNCLSYRNPYEFVANLQWALTHDPEPLTEELAREFTWEAATDRLMKAAAITRREAHQREALGKSKIDERIAWFHNELGKGAKGDVIRKVFGAGPVSDQVKYEQQKQRDTGLEEDEDEDSGEGLSRKFNESAFVRAIRQATAISITAIRSL